MEINQEKFIQDKPEKSLKEKPKKAKNSNYLIVLIVVIILFVLMIYFLSKVGTAKEKESEINYPKESLPIKTIQSNVISNITPPPLTAKNMIDENAIEETKKEIENNLQEEKQEENTTNETYESIQQSNKNNNQNETKPDEKNETKEFLDDFKSKVEIKVNFFRFNGKNYYEGDSINHLKVIEVTRKTIKLKDKNNVILEINKNNWSKK